MNSLLFVHVCPFPCRRDVYQERVGELQQFFKGRLLHLCVTDSTFQVSDLFLEATIELRLSQAIRPDVGLLVITPCSQPLSPGAYPQARITEIKYTRDAPTEPNQGGGAELTCIRWFICFLLLACLAPAQSSAPQPSNTAYINGYWFDGHHFSRRTVYVVGDTLEFRRPNRIDATVDLNGGYVVPPFGEAHNHNVEPINHIPELVATYFEHGIFYVKDPDNLPRYRIEVEPSLNRPDSIDVVFANGGWTSPGGHPAEIVKRNVDRHLWTEADGEGAFYWTAATPSDVAAKWSAYLAQHPQFVKVYLLYADDSHRQADAARYFGWKGLAPDVLAEIVKRAHQAHLRVTAHIESAADFHDALVAGVDEITHMPGFRMFADVDSHPASEFELSDADAELAHRRGVFVLTTLVGATSLSGARRREQDVLNVFNLHKLLAHHVKVALGSDSYRQDTLAEAKYIASLHVVPRATLLRMWTEATADTIFPTRQIGRLRPGYEASFLVIAGNPLDDFSNVTRISQRVKQGHTLK